MKARSRSLWISNAMPESPLCSAVLVETHSDLRIVSIQSVLSPTSGLRLDSAETLKFDDWCWINVATLAYEY